MSERPASELAETLAREEERLLTCVHCGLCLPACPTYVRLGDEADSPRGRLHLMRAVAEGRLAPDSDAFLTHIDRCLGCRACEPVCPSGVPYGHLLERARSVAAESRRPDLGSRALLKAFESPGRTRVIMALARAVRGTGLPRLLARVLPARWALPPAMLAATGRTSLPVAAAGGREAEALPDRRTGAPEGVPRNGRVGLLTGCVQEGLLGRVNRATVRVLEANGYEVVPVPGQACCGALHAHAGDLRGAGRLARIALEAFGGAEVDFVCANAAGCGAHLRRLHDLLGEGDGPALELAAKVRDVSELLAAAGPRPGAPLDVTVAYDPPCHLLHAQGVVDAPLRVLDAVPGLRRVDHEDAAECCGGAGLYGMTHPELGGGIGRDKVRSLRASGAAVAATGNPGCMMQIGAFLLMHPGGDDPVVAHPVEILDESYRRAGIYGNEGSDAGQRSSRGEEP